MPPADVPATTSTTTRVRTPASFATRLEKIDVERLALRVRLRREVCVEQGRRLDEPVQLLRDAVHVDRERRAAVTDDAEPQLLRRVLAVGAIGHVRSSARSASGVTVQASEATAAQPRSPFSDSSSCFHDAVASCRAVARFFDCSLVVVDRLLHRLQVVAERLVPLRGRAELGLGERRRQLLALGGRVPVGRARGRDEVVERIGTGARDGADQLLRRVVERDVAADRQVRRVRNRQDRPGLKRLEVGVRVRLARLRP